MKLVMVRVDDRLIHGQVTMGWTRQVGPDRIVVANDRAATDPLQRAMLEMAPAPGVQLSVLEVAAFQAAVASGSFGSERVFLIVATPVDLVRLLDGGTPIDDVVVGNIGYRAGRRTISKEVHADEAELEALRELARRGVRLVAQWLPNSGRMDLARELERIK